MSIQIVELAPLLTMIKHVRVGDNMIGNGARWLTALLLQLINFSG
jgi:hypothetical protein